MTLFSTQGVLNKIWNKLTWTTGNRLKVDVAAETALPVSGPVTNAELVAALAGLLPPATAVYSLTSATNATPDTVDTLDGWNGTSVFITIENTDNLKVLQVSKDGGTTYKLLAPSEAWRSDNIARISIKVKSTSASCDFDLSVGVV